MNTKPLIYFAGKISKNDWRHTLVPSLRGAKPGSLLQGPGCTYSGPYFISCKHGCYHQNSHGHALGEPITGCTYMVSTGAPARDSTPALCREWIQRSDAMLAWINDPTCYGTLVEIGWAQMMGKPIYIGFHPPYLAEEIWFPTQVDNTWSGIHSDPRFALAKTLQLIGKR